MNRIDGIEERLLIFLKIAIIRGGKRFQHRQDRDQISIKPAGLAARQLRHIGILLLRHQARAGGKSVAELHETEFARAPGDQIFAQTREMHSDHRQAKRNSQTKSRSPTASTLFWLAREKPSWRAIAWRSRTMVDPASAPDPSGRTSVRVLQSRRRSESRSRASSWASK